MIVKVKYKNYKGEYEGRAYAYTTKLPLEAGDIVVAPTYKGDSPAMVCATNIDAMTLDIELLKLLKEITERYVEDENL